MNFLVKGNCLLQLLSDHSLAYQKYLLLEVPLFQLFLLNSSKMEIIYESMNYLNLPFALPIFFYTHLLVLITPINQSN